jgi:hypothetical protein
MSNNNDDLNESNMTIIDAGYSSKKLVQLIQDSLPAEKKESVKHFCINPFEVNFDTGNK